MRRHSYTAVAATIVMVLAGLAPGIGLAVGAAAQAGPNTTAAPLAQTLSYSYNWAGYAAVPSSGVVTVSAGSWIEPTLSCTSRAAYFSEWVGIDGYANSYLVQTGTGAQCVGGVASYNAWWEVLPASETVISKITVSAGDHMTAAVTYLGSGTFRVWLNDTTAKTHFQKMVTSSGSPLQSAECIAERPEVNTGLAAQAKHAPAKFTACTATLNGVTGTIGSFSTVYQIDMVNNADTKVIGSVSSLTSKGGFTETWHGYS
jgi:hypothetical protein